MLATILFHKPRDPVLWGSPAIRRRINPFLVDSDTFDVSRRVHFVVVRPELWQAHEEKSQRGDCGCLGGLIPGRGSTDLISMRLPIRVDSCWLSKTMVLCHRTGTAAAALVPDLPVMVLILVI
jgi:hypothetical protein